MIPTFIQAIIGLCFYLLFFYLLIDYIKNLRYKFSNTRNIENTILNNISTFYKKKSSCMNSNEARVYYYINKALDELIPDKKERSTYFVFPQVSLHSFITTIENHSLYTTYELNFARKIFLNKNIDYLICRSCKKNISSSSSRTPVFSYYEYCPILMFELDGSSHYSAARYGKKNLQQQQYNDHLKDSLSKNLDIPLLRYNLTNDQIHRYDYKNIKLALNEYIPKGD